MQRINCAVYARKSTEKGMDQEFNSLQNQEQACKNYILSQAYNGWEYYKTYTDSGISGGTMKRQALENMLGDIKNGLIQTVVVYKVDRLSRSILDFHNMMKEFDKYNCSFVSITQAFDTSTSMGKLTLNMLLSFAQFEREVASERIRDKINASKIKGFWTGGSPPIGYDVIDKKLVLNKDEALQVKYIFEKYLEVKSLKKLRKLVANAGIRCKKWISQGGNKKGGSVFSPSMLARKLRAKVYIGRIESKKNKASYSGKHPAIIDKKLFDTVQKIMNENMNKHNKIYDKEGYLLSRKIYDNNGNMFLNQKGSKNSVKKYRYYALKGQYLPAGDLEEITVQTIKKLLDYSLKKLLNKPDALEFKFVDFDSLTTKERAKLIRLMVDKIIYHKNKMTYFINIGDLSYIKAFIRENYINFREDKIEAGIFISKDNRHLIVEKEICINRNNYSNKYIGKGKKIISISENSNNLIKALSVGWRYNIMARNGIPVRTIASKEKKDPRTVHKYLCLTYLSPNIVNDIMESKVPSGINLQLLFSIASRYVDFKDQENSFY